MAWFAAGNPTFAPAPLPAPAYGGAACVFDGVLYILGGVDGDDAPLNTVLAYDPDANAWTALDPLPWAFVPQGGQAAGVDGWLYAVGERASDEANVLIRYNVGTGTTQVLDDSLAYPAAHLVALGTIIYAGLATPAPFALDTSDLSLGAAPGTSPYATAHSGEAVAVDGSSIIVAGGINASFVTNDAVYRYTPATGTWTALADLPAPRTYLALGTINGKPTIIGGLDAFGAPVADAHELDDGSWGAIDDAPVGLAFRAYGVIGDLLFLFGGYDFADAFGTAHAYGALPWPGYTDLSVEMDVLLAFINPTEATLSIEMDVFGGTAVQADLLVGMSTGTIITADLVVGTDTLPPAPGSPGGEPLGSWGVGVARSADYLSYSLSWALGDGLTGDVTLRGRTPGGTPPFAPAGEYANDPTFSWSRGGEVTTTRRLVGATRAALEAEVLPELMPDVGSLTPGIGVGRSCLQPTHALLCSGVTLEVACATLTTGLIDDILPTRLALATAALDAAGISLALFPGPGLAGLDEPVPADYTTEGKTADEVVADMLLRSNPRSWFAPGVLFVDGRALPSGTLAAPANPLVAPVGLWNDEAVDGGDISVTTNTPGDAPVAPVLADFTAECDDATDPEPCSGRTFETAQSAILEWTERAGSDYLYTETDYRIVKVGGRITEERTVTRAMRMLFGRSLGVGAAGLTGEAVLMPVEWTEKTNTYLACCPEALAHSVERTWVPRIYDTTGITDPSSDPDVYLSTMKELRQTWHAEGWLRSRIETEAVLNGWSFSGSGTFPTYKVRSRIESNLPIGNGLWRIDTRLHDTAPMPITESVGGSIEYIGVRNAATVTAYTVMTDAAPASVSCGELDPCDPDADCATLAARRYAAAVAAYEDELAVHTARALNQPERMLVQSFTLDRGATVALGDLITTTRGDAIVTRISWSGTAGEQPRDNVQVEAWSSL